MKRTGLIAVLGLSLVALVAPGVSAHGGHDGHDGRGSHGLRAFATDGAVGSSMTIYASVGGHGPKVARLGHHRSGCDSVTVGAVVNFQTGPVSVDLPAVQGSHGVSRRLFEGTVGVAGEEPIGPITVDVTATCGDRSAMVTVSANITEGSAPLPPQET